MTAATTRWFTERRSLAVALVSAGIGLGASPVGPLARYLITAYDWRTAMFVLGNLAWLVIIPAALLVREPPAAVGAGAPGTRGAGGRRPPRGQGPRPAPCPATAPRAFPRHSAPPEP